MTLRTKEQDQQERTVHWWPSQSRRPWHRPMPHCSNFHAAILPIHKLQKYINKYIMACSNYRFVYGNKNYINDCTINETKWVLQCQNECVLEHNWQHHHHNHHHHQNCRLPIKNHKQENVATASQVANPNWDFIPKQPFCYISKRHYRSKRLLLQFTLHRQCLEHV